MGWIFPGTYSVLCQAEDAEGNLSQVIGYTVTVVPEEDFQTIEGNLDSEIDVKTYNVDIDFSEMSSAAICVVKMGDSDIDVKVYDSDRYCYWRDMMVITISVLELHWLVFKFLFEIISKMFEVWRWLNENW